MVKANVGSIVGVMVCVIVGGNVLEIVGTLVVSGSGTGKDIGKLICVGAVVRDIDGETVGAREGINDGCMDGAMADSLVGANVGRNTKPDGACVVALVGALVAIVTPVTSMLPEHDSSSKHPCRSVIHSQVAPSFDGTTNENSAHGPQLPPPSSFSISLFPSASCNEIN